VVGLNPSTATRDKSDPTAAKVERVARAHGYDGFVLVNLCPVRATDSRTLPATVDSKLLAANLRAIAEVVRAVGGVTLWAAWGGPILTRPFLVGAEAPGPIRAFPSSRFVSSLYTAPTAEAGPKSRSRPAAGIAAVLLRVRTNFENGPEV
jgi:hypothetical protein